MPIRQVNGGYKWGDHGKVYPTRAQAARQAAAAHANGWGGDASMAAISNRIAEEVRKGHGQEQAAAIAYSELGEDMSPEEWAGLLGGLTQFFAEEMREPEHASDRLALDAASVRKYDSDGRLHVEKVHISKAGVNPYYGREIPGAQELGLDPERVYQLLRDPKELERAAKTFDGVQLLIRHVPVSADDHRPDEVVGSIGTSAEWNDPYLDNALVVWPNFAIDVVETGEQKELSSAYKYRPDMTPGEFEGQRYDGVMRDIVGNHVALVKKGRAGSDVVVGDEAPDQTREETGSMSKPKTLSRAAIRVHGAILAHVAPRLAMDAAPKFSAALVGLLQGVNAKNLKEKRAAVWKGARDAAEPMLTPEAKASGGVGPDDVIMRILDMVEGQVAAPAEAEMDEAAGTPAADPQQAQATTESNSGEPDMSGKVLEFLKGKGVGDADLAEVKKMIGAKDETPEEKKAREEKAAADKKAADEKAAKDAAEKPMVTKEAMDAAIVKVRTDTIADVRREQRELSEARADVRPWAGDVSMALDSAEAIYRGALTALGVDAKDVRDVAALRLVLHAQPKPGDRRGSREDAAIAQDAAAEQSLAARFPHAARIGLSG